MSSPLENTTLIDVDETTIKMMVVFGHVRRCPDGIYELTPEGSKWLQEYCDMKLAEHAASLP